jgi:hypothetical protein
MGSLDVEGTINQSEGSLDTGSISTGTGDSMIVEVTFPPINETIVNTISDITPTFPPINKTVLNTISDIPPTFPIIDDTVINTTSQSVSVVVV